MPPNAAVLEAQRRAAADHREYRYLVRPVELRADGDAGRRMAGHAAVFNVDQPIGPASNPYWIERIAPGAFRQSIEQDDVRALFNHDANIVLGRNRAGTLRMVEDEIGLAVEIIPPDTQAGRDLLVSIERGDITQMSFGFYSRRQMWEELADGSVRRTLQEVELFDVSPVTYPAFPATDIQVREARAAGLLGASDAEARAAVARSLQRARNQLALADRAI
jgi:HK97 family phage prohead protease